MWKVILHCVKATFPIIAGFSTFMNSAFSQQHVIADKDNTRPEATAQQNNVAKIKFFSAVQMEGYNEIQWSALLEQDTRRYIIEYSADGINYQTAGEAVPLAGTYKLKHYTLDTRTFLYRIRMENYNGKFFNSGVFLLEGSDISPVKLYPTTVEGNTINLRLDLPVERTSIISTDGREVFAKELGGKSGTLQVVIPSLSKGMYWMTFYGNGWQATEGFVVGR